MVLNVYRRSKYFPMQMKALLEQSITPWEILVWENGEDKIPQEFRDKVITSRADQNFGVWARFAYALNAKGEYILVLDDDTIPGKGWIENCLETLRVSPGILGTRGLKFSSRHSYAGYSEVGVYSPNEEIERVDIVGHAWFFKRDLLGAFWAEYPNRFVEDLSGEDIHFSYAVQKVLGLGTFVPPHPAGKEELWGSSPILAESLGSDEAAISSSSDALGRFERAYRHYISLGFELAPESSHRIGQSAGFSPAVAFLMGRMPRVTTKLSGSRFGKLLRRIFLGESAS